MEYLLEYLLEYNGLESLPWTPENATLSLSKLQKWHQQLRLRWTKFPQKRVTGGTKRSRELTRATWEATGEKREVIIVVIHMNIVVDDIFYENLIGIIIEKINKYRESDGIHDRSR